MVGIHFIVITIRVAVDVDASHFRGPDTRADTVYPDLHPAAVSYDVGVRLSVEVNEPTDGAKRPASSFERWVAESQAQT